MKYMKVEQLLEESTISVNEAAYVSGISRSTAYKAVEDGQFFETVIIKGRIRVLARPLYVKLMGSALPCAPGAAVGGSGVADG